MNASRSFFTHRMRLSRLNQVIWRLAKCRVSLLIRSTACSSVAAAVHLCPRPPYPELQHLEERFTFPLDLGERLAGRRDHLKGAYRVTPIACRDPCGIGGVLLLKLCVKRGRGPTLHALPEGG